MLYSFIASKHKYRLKIYQITKAKITHNQDHGKIFISKRVQQNSKRKSADSQKSHNGSSRLYISSGIL